MISHITPLRHLFIALAPVSALFCCSCTYTYTFSPEHDSTIKELIAQSPSKEIQYSEGTLSITPGPIDNIVGFLGGRVIHPFYNLCSDDYADALNNPEQRNNAIMVTPFWMAWSALAGPERAPCDIALAQSGQEIFNYTQSYGTPGGIYGQSYIGEPVPMPPALAARWQAQQKSEYLKRTPIER